MSATAHRAFLAAALLVAAPAAADAQAAAPLVDSVPSITVEGEAVRDVVPDLALVTLGVTSDRPTALQAAQDNARAAAAMVASARSAGLDEADITTSELRLAAVTDPRDPSKVKTFRASNQITLRIRDLGKVGAVVGQLTAQGANTVDDIVFEVADPRPVLDALRATATQDAARQAEIYARSASVKLGRILRIAPVGGGSMPMPRAFKLQMAEAAPAPPVEAGTQKLEARVQITWELAP